MCSYSDMEMEGTMPGLLIWDNGYRWVARCVNTRVEYEFLGQYPGEQTINVRRFAESMSNGDAVDCCDVLDLNNEDPDTVVQQLFVDNDSMSLNMNVFWDGSADGES